MSRAYGRAVLFSEPWRDPRADRTARTGQTGQTRRSSWIWKAVGIAAGVAFLAYVLSPSDARSLREDRLPPGPEGPTGPQVSPGQAPPAAQEVPPAPPRSGSQASAETAGPEPASAASPGRREGT